MTTRHQVLLVEDNLPDVVLAQKALSVLEGVDVHVASNVDAATEMLVLHRIDLLLLDLNLPKISGFELLRRLKGEDNTKAIPVVVMTSSSAEDDIRRAFEAGASGYLIKPLSLKRYREMADTLGTYWFQTSRLPAR